MWNKVWIHHDMALEPQLWTFVSEFLFFLYFKMPWFKSLLFTVILDRFCSTWLQQITINFFYLRLESLTQIHNVRGSGCVITGYMKPTQICNHSNVICDGHSDTKPFPTCSKDCVDRQCLHCNQNRKDQSSNFILAFASSSTWPLLLSKWPDWVFILVSDQRGSLLSIPG